MTGYAEGEPTLSPSESKIINELVRQLRGPPQANGLVKWLPTINAVLAVILAAVIAGAATAYNSSTKQISDNVTSIGTLTARVDGIEKDRAAKNAAIETRFGGIDKDLRRFQIVDDMATRLTEAVKGLDDKLNKGKEDRVTDIEKLNDGLTGVRLEVGSVKAELTYLRQAIEAQNRGPQAPFKRPSFVLPQPPPPFIEASAEPKAVETAPRPAHRKRVVRFHRRAPVLLAELTRSLEQSFGKPAWRGRYWGSLSQRRARSPP